MCLFFTDNQNVVLILNESIVFLCSRFFAEQTKPVSGPVFWSLGTTLLQARARDIVMKSKGQFRGLGCAHYVN